MGRVALAMSLMALGAAAQQVSATTITLPAQVTPVDAGTFVAGTKVQLSFTGTVDLVGGGYVTNSDGSLAAPTLLVPYASEGSTNYPSVLGGDGVNHFVGGGSNFNNGAGPAQPFAGALTTDTTDLNAIRFGAVVGTFSNSPGRSDWFLVGSGTTLTVPTGGGDLRLAVNDTFFPDDTGAYTGSLDVLAAAPAPVPEPITAGSVLLATAGLAGWMRVRRAR